MEALFPGSDPTSAPTTGIGLTLLNGGSLNIFESGITRLSVTGREDTSS
ncbi:MAG: hypothetical protein HPY63_04440 [Methanobacteriaceae archaeon]|nr:hypothetical protein [Methanobacteriaceae archaeon]